MCGIAGFVSVSPVEAEGERIVGRMLAKIAHRGPDGEGTWHDRHAFLGHRRLAIVDLAGGHQPMANENRARWITYNGEVFNHAALRPALEAAGHRYQSRSDTETLLHAFEEHGAASVERLRGMFAYAIWDSGTQELFAVRDRLGIKPFYYFWNGAVFVFASEIKALFEHPDVRREAALETLPEYLAFGYLNGGQTMFRGVHALAPGHHLRLRLGGGKAELHIERYWDAPAPLEDTPRDAEEVAAELTRVVEMRLMSDVPLGLFLSGGVDSSAMAAMVRRMAPGPVKTFSVGYAEERYSELGYARQTAAALGTEHREVRISDADFFGALPRLIWHEDEPIAWPSSVSLYFVSKLAREEVTVVLTGEGADELFAGYQRYRHYQRDRRLAGEYGKLPAWMRSLVRRGIENAPGLGADLRRKLGHTILAREASLESLYLDNYYGAFPAAEIGRLIPGAGQEAIYGDYRRRFDAHPAASTLRRLLYADQKTYLAELLRKQDRMSMATGIESRVPFLDHEFVALAAGLPDEAKLGPNGENKYLLKRAVAGWIPPEIAARPKMGFPTPLRNWLLGRYRKPVEELLRDRRGFVSQTLDARAVETMLGRVDREDMTDRVWRLLTLELWGRQFFLGGADGAAVDIVA